MVVRRRRQTRTERSPRRCDQVVVGCWIPRVARSISWGSFRRRPAASYQRGSSAVHGCHGGPQPVADRPDRDHGEVAAVGVPDDLTDQILRSHPHATLHGGAAGAVHAGGERHQLTARMLPDDLDDDIALVAVRLHAQNAPRLPEGRPEPDATGPAATD
jgi:hypothetical protein